ncbi:putative Serine hydrolase-like protein [Hypsibius exemplaris]|uniref:Serine hydrolase-like protein n=1 Tax=Hypsibius exemplaris TaxID=2072580 RepID=A0A1W0XDU5_HYPEX|nr:putative Serine hydrolase-like protein [Hypsibius exemplaris]
MNPRPKMAPPARVSREIRINANRTEIAAQEWKHGVPTKNVLLLHGWQDNSNSFNKLVQLLPQEWWLVAIDFPGHGLSSQRPEGAPYIVTDWVSDVRLVVQSESTCCWLSQIII